ncbi:potassium transporter TrkG [Roseinatronobacter alkalisoli]|uniref:Potassium transporter TrkG n=1 Tax=Roseinatronobacter alkalisoli TaxID=3028235 RepID=A0ABT5T7Z5_9RHOB|nr:potassium transporter TrkG [Roseinatronobacter sp. HJB301]MDD7971242.1 potassium transporter TrkG [Roseinatronobacter sp. HJB301]
MAQRSRGTVILLVLVAVTAVAMIVPAAVGFTLREHESARAFLYSAFLLASFTALIYLANKSRKPRERLISHPFFVLSAAYVLLPVLMSIPLTEAVPGLRFADAWFEMLSSFTTTGATLLDNPVPRSVHLWRAIVGWLGGLFVLVYVIAILAPMNMGGFEVLAVRNERQTAGPALSKQLLSEDNNAAAPDATLQRLRLQVGLIAPLYAGLTLLLWVALSIAGNPPLVALILAMSALSTSGIVPGPGWDVAALTFSSEFLLLVFLVLGLSRTFWLAGARGHGARLNWRQIELTFAGVLLAGLCGLFVLGFAFGDDGNSLNRFLRELWSVVFNGLSFLTTTGFISSATDLRSGFFAGPAGIVLLGLALIGGGVATTAGGLKLMRIFALMWQAKYELQHLVHPAAVGGDGAHMRGLRTEGAFSAWLFLLIFILGLGLVMAALSILGSTMEDALSYAVAALTTTGPLVQIAGSVPLTWTELGDAQRAVLGAGMLLGRLEFLLLLSVLWPRS